LFFQVILYLSALLFFSGCGTESSQEKEYLKRNSSNHYAENEPSSFREYALISSGNIEVSGNLITDGPLADVHSNGKISANTRSLDVSGQITTLNGLNPSSVLRSFSYEKSSGYSKVRALKVEEFLNISKLDDFYTFGNDGFVKYRGEKVEIGFANFENGVWTISGDELNFGVSLKIETSLVIDSNITNIYGLLMVEGDLKVKGDLNIDNKLPFNKGLIVDSDIEVDKLQVVGRVFGSGNFIANGDVEVTGNIEIDKNVKLYGENNRINFLDNIYKASIFESQNENSRDMRIADSQLFKNLNGQNSIMLFTFSKNGVVLDSLNFYKLLENNLTNIFEFETHVYGANLNYGAELVVNEGLLPYYENTLKVFKKLKDLGHKGVRITESLDIAPLNLYHTFEDESGNNLGTYLVFSISNPPIDTNLSKLELTAEMREKVLEEMLSEKLEEEIVEYSIEDNIIPLEDLNFSENVDEVSLEDIQNEILKEWAYYQTMKFGHQELNTTKYLLIPETNQTTRTRGMWNKIEQGVSKVVGGDIEEVFVSGREEVENGAEKLGEEFENGVYVTFEIAVNPVESAEAIVTNGTGAIDEIKDSGEERINGILNGDEATIVDTALSISTGGWSSTIGVSNYLNDLWLYGCQDTIKKTIQGVSFNRNDDRWTDEIQLGNPKGEGCVPVSATMITEYHNRIIQGKTSLYVDSDGNDTNITRDNPVFGEGTNPIALAEYMYDEMGTDKVDGTDFFDFISGRVTNAIKKSFKRYGVSKSPVAYIKMYYSHLNIESTGRLVESYIRSNNPVILTYIRNYSIEYMRDEVFNEHGMPVIGYVKKSLIPCLRLPLLTKRYLYTDTTWQYKTYFRFDMLSQYFGIGSITFIKK
jgi:hypothetical protein